MNMENFITGFPGHEHEHRAAMLEVLGQEKYDFFFDKVWLIESLVVCILMMSLSFSITSSHHQMPDFLRSRE